MFANIKSGILGVNYNYANQQQISVSQHIFWPNSLFYAIESNDYEAVNCIIQKCMHLINLNYIYKSYSFLSGAILIKNEYIVELLLQHKANPNFMGIPHLGCFPLNLVISNILDENNSRQHIDYQILQLLFKFKADPNVFTKYEPLTIAVAHKSCTLVALLLDNGANPYNGMVMCLSNSRFTKISVIEREREQWLNIENLFSSKYIALFRGMIKYLTANLNEDPFIDKIYKPKDTTALPQTQLENETRVTILWDNYTDNRNEFMNTVLKQDEYDPDNILKFIEKDGDFSLVVEPYRIISPSNSSNKYFNKI